MSDVLPTHLFKFRQFDKFTHELIATNSIYFPSPALLNDPLDCRPCFSFEGASEADRRSVIQRYFAVTRPELSPRERWLLARRNPPRWADVEASVREQLESKIGVLSLSSSSMQTELWATYAAHRAGFVLEFSRDKGVHLGIDIPGPANAMEFVFEHAEPVEYVDQVPAVNFFGTDPPHQYEQIFLHKTTRWRPEQEWRVLDFQKGSGPHWYPPACLRRIIFGEEMPNDQRSAVMVFATERCEGFGTAITIAEALHTARAEQLEIIDTHFLPVQH